MNNGLFLKYNNEIVVHVLSFFMSMWINSLAQVILSRTIFEDYESDKVLYDIGFTLLPFINNPIIIGVIDYLPKMLPLFLFIFFLITKRYKSIILWLRVVTIIFIIRAFLILVTILPNPAPYCIFDTNYRNSSDTTFFLILYESNMVFVGMRETCNDVFFSGHISIITITVIVFFYSNVIEENKKKNNNYQNAEEYWNGEENLKKSVCSTIFIFIYSILMILVRLHYTIDIIMGIFISLVIYTVNKK